MNNKYATNPYCGSSAMPNVTMPSVSPGMMPGMMPGALPGGTGGYYGMVPGTGTGTTPPGFSQLMTQEESYIENILRLNLGKEATVYMTFEDGNREVFKGIVEAAGRDHIILSDPKTGKRYLLLMVYLDYITFDEPLEYFYPFAGQRPLRPR